MNKQREVQMETLSELRAREDEIARQWEWLQEALNEVARVRSERGDAEAFRLIQGQAMEIGQRRVQIWMQMAELEGMQHGGQQRRQPVEIADEPERPS